jgi:hypothetical protein
MKKEELIKELLKQFIYERDGKSCVDYCHNCKRFIQQVEIRDGVFGCEYCNTDSSIECFIEVE